MARIPSLNAEVRKETGSRAARRIRRSGRIPAILYGHKQENVPLTVDHDEVERLLRHGAHLVELVIDGKTERALLKEVQHDFVGDGLHHVDFSRVAMDETVEVEVSLDFHGTPEGVTHGGVVEYHETTVTVECLPADIPESIRVDVAHLQVGEVMHASDLVLPPGVKLAGNPEEMVVGVLAPRAAAEAVEAAEAEEEAAEPEVIGEKKQEKEKEE